MPFVNLKIIYIFKFINLTVNKSVNLNQVEMRIRSEISELNLQDRFEQSIVLEKLQIERPDFSAKLVEYVKLLVDARADLNRDEPVPAQEKLKLAAEISAEFPAGYEMLGIDQLIPEYVPEGTDAITPAQWGIIGTLGVILLFHGLSWLSDQPGQYAGHYLPVWHRQYQWRQHQ